MPRSRALQDAARNLRFDTARWPGRPAVHHHQGQPDAGVLRNVAIDTDPWTTRALFRGRLVDGVATVTERVPALPAGTDSFRCDVHPSTMNGTLVGA
jgi:hypothetical protein